MIVYFYFHYVYPDKIMRYLSSIHSGACGADGVSLAHLKFLIPAALPVVVHFLNSSFMHSVFPSEWKKLLIISIKKVRNP